MLLIIPKEFAIGGVFIPPGLMAAVIGLILTMLTAKLLNKYRLSKYLYYPPMVFISLVIVYTLLVSFIFLPI